MLARIERGLELVLRVFAYGAGLVLVGLMVLIVYEVTMRYGFGRPFRGGYEMTELAMSLIVALALPWTAITGGHVKVDLLSRWLDRPSMRWLACLVHLLGATLLAFVAWRAGLHAYGSFRFGDTTNMMRIQRYPFQFAVALSAGLFALVLLLEAVKSLRPAGRPAGARAESTR